MKAWIYYLVIFVTLMSFPLNVTATEAFPLEKALADYKNLPSLAKYSYSKEYFKLLVLSPVSGYRMAIKNKNKSIYSKHKLSIKDPNIVRDSA